MALGSLSPLLAAAFSPRIVCLCRQGKANFGDAGVFVEKYVQRARHIEVQMFGDGEGNVVTFVERECSIQRRHQKVVEETPSPYVGEPDNPTDTDSRLSFTT